MTPYDRWLKFISKPSEFSHLTFPTDEANAIMAIPLRNDGRDGNWRRDKREINKAVKELQRARRCA